MYSETFAEKDSRRRKHKKILILVNYHTFSRNNLNFGAKDTRSSLRGSMCFSLDPNTTPLLMV
jgi:hypothetical protein